MWFRVAAEAGLHLQCRPCARRAPPDRCRARPRNTAEAARWLRISAEAGDTRSKYDLAALVMQGQATSEDSVRTREWFEEAAASGDLVAAFNYGICLAQGVGVERDDARAAEWRAVPPMA